MKIAILTPSVYMYQKLYSARIFAPGELVRHLVSGLQKRGHDVSWLTAPEKSDAQIVPGDVDLLEKKLELRTFQDISPEIRERMGFYASKTYYELDLVAKAYAMAKSEGVELIHCYHTTLYSAHFFEELTGTPTVYTIHDPLPTDNMLELWLFHRFPKHKYLSISLNQRGTMADYFYDNVYHGIDTDEFAYCEKPTGGFVSVGRLTAEKGFDVSMRVAKQANVELLIATWITQNVEASAYYQKSVLPFVDGKQIKLSGLLEKDERVKMYQNGRALLFPIQWEEPFGMVMLEAMSCGTPVIAYNRGSVKELVVDGVTGFIVDPDDTDRPGKGRWIIKKSGTEGLVEAVNRIGEISRIATRKHIEEHFTLDHMAKEYERVYRRVLDATLARKGETFSG